MQDGVVAPTVFRKGPNLKRIFKQQGESELRAIYRDSPERLKFQKGVGKETYTDLVTYFRFQDGERQSSSQPENNESSRASGDDKRSSSQPENNESSRASGDDKRSSSQPENTESSRASGDDKRSEILMKLKDMQIYVDELWKPKFDDCDFNALAYPVAEITRLLQHKPLLKMFIKECTATAVQVEFEEGRKCYVVQGWPRFSTESAKESPYFYLKKWKIRFAIVDSMALANGWWIPSTPLRIEAMVHSICEDAESQNDTFVSEDGIVAEALNKNVEKAAVLDALHRFEHDGDLVVIYVEATRQRCFQTAEAYEAERQLASSLKILQGRIVPAIQYAKDEHPIQPDTDQTNAIRASLCSSVSILLGPGGSGKTSVVLRNAARILEHNGVKVRGVTPTHAARKVLERELDGYNVKVKCLAAWTHARCAPLRTALDATDEGATVVFIMDESSMYDVRGLRDFVRTCVSYTSMSVRLIFAGDDNQLSPVGLGCPLVDMIKSQLFEVSRLTVVRRTGSEGITSVAECYSSNTFWSVGKNRYYTHEQRDSQDVSLDLLPDGLELNHVRERAAQLILAKKEALRNEGVDETKLRLLTWTNDDCYWFSMVWRQNTPNINHTITAKTYVYKPGENVVFKKNTTVFKNGDEGTIVTQSGNDVDVFIANPPDWDRDAVLEKDWEVIEDIYAKDEGCCVRCSRYALGPGRVRTVHKAQGMGEDYVAFIAIRAGTGATRNLNYTAITRAKRKLFIIGTIAALNGRRARTAESRATMLGYHLTGNHGMLICNAQDKAALKSRAAVKPETRLAVWDRDFGKLASTGRCSICNYEVHLCRFHVAHVIARIRGGTDEMENLRATCSWCNLKMGTQNLEDYARARREA